MEIIPSILSSDPDEARALLAMCERVTNRAHIDIIDSRFADNKTITPEEFSEDIFITKLDFHLMVENPVQWIHRCSEANADRVIGQIELMNDQLHFCSSVGKADMLCGVALDLPTEINAIDEDILPMVDVIVVMSVNAGHGGQSFDEKAIKKIEDLVLLRKENNYHYRLCDDGGVSLENQKLLEEAGVDEVSVGRRLFQGNLAENIETWNRVISRYNKI